jgi:two-component system nitrogen regulation sensor histidine kinase NtrY
MVFSRFIWTILGLVGSVTGTAVILGIYMQKPGFPLTRSLLIALLALETILLIWYLVRIRRDLLRLILALRNEDPTLRFSSLGKDPYFSAIHRGFNEIIRDFRLVRLDREAESRFFEATVNHIRFGIIAFHTDGSVRLANDSFLEIFRTGKISSVDDLDKTVPGLPEWLKQLPHGAEELKKITVSGRPSHLIFLASRIRVKEEKIMIVSVRDISREIDRNELEAWQKLMRVLRHEILNSLSPIRLLSANLSELAGRELDAQEAHDLKTGLETIHRRASGLSGFLDAYSNLYRVPELKLEKTRAGSLLRRIHALFRDQMEAAGIRCTVDCPDEELTILMDERMIEQVLINLVRNALEAVQGSPDPSLTLSALLGDEGGILAVSDNGRGIPPDQLDHIFIPFYSTRKEGSGIGLSFSQHIMRLHNGRINVRSDPGAGSEFRLLFGKQ